MKSLLLSLFAIPLFTASQEPAEGIFPVKDSQIYYERILTIDSLNAEDIYKLTKSWGVGAFAALRDPVKADDKELGLIAYHSYFTIPYRYPSILGDMLNDQNRYEYSMKIFIKDKKVKIAIGDIYFEQCTFGGRPQILTLRENTEEILIRAWAGKKRRDRVYEEYRNNFIIADEYFKGLIGSLENALKNGKDELNF